MKAKVIDIFVFLNKFEQIPLRKGARSTRGTTFIDANQFMKAVVIELLETYLGIPHLTV